MEVKYWLQTERGPNGARDQGGKGPKGPGDDERGSWDPSLGAPTQHPVFRIQTRRHFAIAPNLLNEWMTEWGVKWRPGVFHPAKARRSVETFLTSIIRINPVISI